MGGDGGERGGAMVGDGAGRGRGREALAGGGLRGDLAQEALLAAAHEERLQEDSFASSLSSGVRFRSLPTRSISALFPSSWMPFQ